MRRALFLWTILLVGWSVRALAQSTFRIESGDAEIVLTVWHADEQPEPTVLLVPGWGGGPTDVLGIAEYLSENNVETVVLTPRGWHDSGGTATFANAQVDIATALQWVRSERGERVALGGHSWGGGMSLAYAARDSTVRRVFSVAGTDHGLLIRQYAADAAFRSMVDRILASTKAPEGDIRFDVAYTMNELEEGQAKYGLIENADVLSGRSILLFGGWEDVNVTVDRTLLPLYRTLRSAGAEDVTFHVYHADHSFSSARDELHHDLLEWLTR